MMNKSKIEWCTHSQNIITGCNGPNNDGVHCVYCYAKPFAKRIYKHGFEPHFFENRLDEMTKEKEPSRIFMNSMGDAFGDWVPSEWIIKMLKACVGAPRHTYYFLTKNPKRYFEPDIHIFFRVNNNFWAGFTAETGSLYRERWQWFQLDPRPQTFVSIEPMFDGKHKLDQFGTFPGWVIVGAQTKPDRFPNPRWIKNIRNQCKVLGIPLFEKNSLLDLGLPGGLIQQVPEISTNPMELFNE